MRLVSCFVASIILAVSAEDSVTLSPPVDTSYGPVQGAVQTYDGTTVHVFKGIPFAAPPVGELRFASPVAPESWTDPLRCVDYRNRCVANYMADILFYKEPRVAPPMSEDCLHLSVVAPQGGQEKRAVMLYIHGGGLAIGSSTDMEIEGLAVGGDVIHVAINYRLNIFGFLASADDSAPGNAGFYDQLLALKWVKENIANFGGDPERITIFGISAGGWSVSAHMVSPLSRGLFARGIAQSGTMYGFKMENREQRNGRTQRFAETQDCAGTDTEILQCLRNKDARELHDAAMVPTAPYFPLSAPIQGDAFLPESVTALYDKHQTHPGVEYVSGICSEEGALFMMMDFNDTERTIRRVKEGVGMDDSLLQIALMMTSHSVFELAPGHARANALTELIKNFYMKDYDNKIANLRGIFDLTSDVIFGAPTLGMAEKVVEGGKNKMFVYYMDQTPPQEIKTTNIPQLHLHAAPELGYGALHGFDSFYMFGHAHVKDIPSSYAEEADKDDQKVAISMLNAWATFARTGTPVYSAANGVKVEWPEYDMTTEEYLEFKSPMSSESVKRRLKPGINELWNKLVPAYLETVEDVALATPEQTEADVKDEL